VSILEVASLDAGYGADFQALFDINLALEPGELLAFVGANGAGKTTLLSCIAGSMPPRAGSIRFRGNDITSAPDYERASAGIALVPEGRRLFASMTVEENLLVGAAARRRGPWTLETVYDLMPLVSERRARGCSHLSGGEQQAVAIARALMSNPDILLLDEVSLGLAPIIVDQLYASLPALRSTGLSILLVEQDLSRTLSVADRIACMLEGRIVLEGRPEEFTRNQITDAYFGHGYAVADLETGTES
jgi:branched-chain amino acid transport system ATP-binding protein